MSSLESQALEFAIKSYKQLSNDTNLVFSPQSLSTALSMTLMGARTASARELSTALFGDVFVADDDNGYESLAKELKQMNDECIESTGTVLSCSNSVYNSTKFAVLPQYQRLLQNYFNAMSRELDFVNKKSEAIDVINGDVKNATNGKIDGIVKDIADDTAMILVNALYFKGDWSSKFNKDHTFVDKFTTNSGQEINVQMMSKSLWIPYAYSRQLRAGAIELGYKVSGVVMMVLLPDEDISVKQMASAMSVESLNQLACSLRKAKLNVFLPKFKVESNLKLIPTLRRMGINGIFDEKSADFSGLSDSKGFYVSDVIQKAVIDVTEEGTEAAAVTAVTSAPSSAAPPMPFRVNRPFMYFLLTKNTQKQIHSIVFMGECNEPNV